MVSPVICGCWKIARLIRKFCRIVQPGPALAATLPCVTFQLLKGGTAMTVLRRALLGMLIALAAAIPASAASVDTDALRDRLFERLAAARTEEEGRQAEDAIWRLWVDHPDQQVREAVALGMRQRDSYEWDKAIQTFSRAILADPAYAEGYNQRAFIYFLKEDFDAALADLEKTLEREPRHFGALSGKAMILMRTGKLDEGQAVLREAVALHPFLNERHMLTPQ
jgi:tetratricopeptide (TPR) repeat protein